MPRDAPGKKGYGRPQQLYWRLRASRNTASDSISAPRSLNCKSFRWTDVELSERHGEDCLVRRAFHAMALRAGDVVRVSSQQDDGWWYGIVAGDGEPRGEHTFASSRVAS